MFELDTDYKKTLDIIHQTNTLDDTQRSSTFKSLVGEGGAGGVGGGGCTLHLAVRDAAVADLARLVLEGRGVAHGPRTNRRDPRAGGLQGAVVLLGLRAGQRAGCDAEKKKT